ncbi:DegT/DnrJ/EryC1/StrS family aminotransferase [Pajaroellobacter abortibovis]|uniref:DegT/DnrJ/EryC1/StrS family aminotransferase n=1 Tax=Pajaroellobacter abortibovis TaxID=1882918 RepID=A0A1L6MZ66_9BACT|nr:DegT/DnrJ/EryC1/StrS family aminotransferase [Pajaroellobacter abortibovis]APS00789.1 hypothetical protein BCY86_08935 [Pajaroellobacter abortibovis]
MRVPFIDLSRLISHIAEEVQEDWEDCLTRCEFIGGTYVSKLETVLAAKLQVPHVIACASGTDALMVGLRALGVERGMKVALPNMTFWATYEVVVQLGAIPILIDIDPDDLQMDFDHFRRAHDEYHFEAAILVHLFGWTSAWIEEFRLFSKDRSIRLLEDAAQGFGVEVGGEALLTGAEVATLSFHPAKVIGGAMDGGAVIASTPQRAEYIRLLCNHGRLQRYSHIHVGWNSRMGGLQAAFLLRVLALSEKVLTMRRIAVAQYHSLLKEVEGVRIYGPPSSVKGNGYLCALTSNRYDGASLAQKLQEQRVGSARIYPGTVDEQLPARGAIRFGTLCRSKEFCRRVLNLPLFYGISLEEQQMSVEALLRAMV